MTFGTIRRSVLADLRGLPGVYLVIMSVMYLGAFPWRALYTSRITLKSILNLTGNQCSDFRTGVM